MLDTKQNINENSFEKLIVWKKAHIFVLEVYALTRLFPSDEKFLLVNQLRRSSSSIAANIVEGNERKTKKEFIQFLYTAKASLSETKYHILLAKDLNYLDNKIYSKLITEANEIGKLINGLINYLKNE